METKTITKNELNKIKGEFLKEYSILCAKYGVYVVGFGDKMCEGEDIKHITTKIVYKPDGSSWTKTVPEVLNDHLSQFRYYKG